MFSSILSIIQIIISILLVAAVLLQQRGAGLSGAFGGESMEYHTRRGFEKILFTATIILSILFVSSTFVALLIK